MDSKHQLGSVKYTQTRTRNDNRHHYPLLMNTTSSNLLIFIAIVLGVRVPVFPLNTLLEFLPYIYMLLMRDEKEERNKQARSNKAEQHSTCTCV